MLKILKHFALANLLLGSLSVFAIGMDKGNNSSIPDGNIEAALRAGKPSVKGVKIVLAPGLKAKIPPVINQAWAARTFSGEDVPGEGAPSPDVIYINDISGL